MDIVHSIADIYGTETGNEVKKVIVICFLFCLKFTLKAYIWSKIAFMKTIIFESLLVGLCYMQLARDVI